MHEDENDLNLYAKDKKIAEGSGDLSHKDQSFIQGKKSMQHQTKKLKMQ